MSAARLKYEQQILTSVRTVSSVNERAIKGVLARLTGREDRWRWCMFTSSIHSFNSNFKGKNEPANLFVLDDQRLISVMTSSIGSWASKQKHMRSPRD
jgi:hypothetical protein